MTLNRKILTKKGLGKLQGKKQEKKTKENNYSWLRVDSHASIFEIGKIYPSLGGTITEITNEKGILKYVFIKVTFSDDPEFQVDQLITLELLKIKKKHVFEIKKKELQTHYKIEKEAA